MAKKAPATEKITRDDLEATFAELQSGIQGKVESKKSTLITAATIGAVVLMLVVFMLGKRSGKRKTTIVEIRRV
jgi:ABC-type Fe3+-siderophore transport system permease subunit